MIYHVEGSPTAYRQMAALPPKDQRRIQRVIDRLAIDPRPPGSKTLKGRSGLNRIRAGDYRMVYRIADDRLVVLVIRIGHRREV